MNSIPPLSRGNAFPLRRQAQPDDHHLDPRRPDQVEEPERRHRDAPAPAPEPERPDHHLDPQRPDSEPETR